jgi:mono/diheme cytochrome c family protein
MKKFFSFLAIAALASCLYAPQAQARPQFVKGLQEAYSKNTAIGEKKCGVCHGKGGADKKVLSDYAKALHEALGGKDAKNEKDKDKIAEAIKKVGEKKQGDKTYADIFGAGELPEAAK